MTSCLNVRDNICAYIDSELNEEEKLDFEEHIGNCSVCRRELEEMTRIVGLCTNIPQQELPTDFRSGLHEKLLAVADRQAKNEKSIWKKKGFLFTRTIASIAAGVLLIFLAGNFVKYDLNSKKSTNSTAQVADMAMAAEEPAASRAVRQESNGDADSGMMADGAAIAEDESFSFSLSVDNSESIEVDRSASPEDRDASTKMAGMAIAEAVYNKLSMITITAEEPEELVQTVRVLAEGNGGEEGVSVIMKTRKAEMEKSEGIEVQFSEAIDALPPPLQFVFPQSNYDQFITVLNDALGAANVQMGAFVSEDVTELLDNMIRESEVIDARLQKLQQENENTDNDEIRRIKIQKEAIDDRIEEMRLDSDNVSVTIYVNQK